MQVSSCCGAQLKEYETPICSCCSEHTDVVEAKRASIEVIDEEYNWPKYSEKIVKERIKCMVVSQTLSLRWMRRSLR